VTDILARIDEVTAARCRRCTAPLAPSGPSPDFCGPDCQHDWADLFVTDPNSVYARTDLTPAELGVPPRPAQPAATFEFDTIPAPEPLAQIDAPRLTAPASGWYQIIHDGQSYRLLPADAP